MGPSMRDWLLTWKNQRKLLLISAILALVVVAPLLLTSGLSISSYGIASSQPANLGSSASDSASPLILTTEANIYVVWADFATGNGDIIFRRSTDGGATFEAGKNLSNSSFVDEMPAIAVSRNNVFLGWQSEGNIYLARSTDSGATFEAAKNLSNSFGTAGNLALVASDSKVYLTWDDNNGIFFKRSINNGTTFEATTNLVTENVGEALGSDIVAVDMQIYVTFFADGDIFFARSTDGGATFEAVKNLSSTGDAVCCRSEVAVEGNNVYIAWEDVSPGNFDIFFARSTDAGATFEAPRNLSWSSEISAKPLLTVNGSNVYVGWTDSESFGSCTGFNKCDVSLKRSTNNGTTFEDTSDLTQNAGSSTLLDVSSSRTTVFVISTDATAGSVDVFLRTSNDGAQTFEPAKNLSKNGRGSVDGHIAPFGGLLFVVWTDTVSNNSDILLTSAPIDRTTNDRPAVVDG